MQPAIHHGTSGDTICALNYLMDLHNLPIYYSSNNRKLPVPVW